MLLIISYKYLVLVSVQQDINIFNHKNQYFFKSLIKIYDVKYNALGGTSSTPLSRDIFLPLPVVTTRFRLTVVDANPTIVFRSQFQMANYSKKLDHFRNGCLNIDKQSNAFERSLLNLIPDWMSLDWSRQKSIPSIQCLIR